MKEEQKKIISDCIDKLQFEDIKKLAWHLAETLPEYIWKVGASSTGKYHPDYTLGEGGLMRHMIASFKFLDYFLSLDQYKTQFTDRERDLLRVAMLFHDGRKSGTQADFEKSKYTKFDHPLMMANEVLNCKDILPMSELYFIAEAISSHMGQWNIDQRTSSVLPLPLTNAQQLVHLADFLASRKDITISVPNDVPQADEDPVVNFGKYTGKTWKEVKKENPQYIQWVLENFKGLDKETKSYLTRIS